MTTVTLRLPDDTCQRLKQLAASRGVSLNKLMEELGTAATATHDAEIRFRTMAASADRAQALAVLNRLDDLDRRGGVEGHGARGRSTHLTTAASTLYEVISEAVRIVDEEMAVEGLGIFYAPELAWVSALWRSIVTRKAELFGERKLDTEWEARWGPIERVDMKLTAGDEVMLFEFKRGSTSNSNGFLEDLVKLSRPPNEPPARRFFCALVDEFQRTSERISSVEKWQHPAYRAIRAVQEFDVLPKRKHPRYRPTHCIVALWELILK
jgi:hypothetical protein